MMLSNGRAAFIALVLFAMAVLLYVQDAHVASLGFMIAAAICMYGAYRPARKIGKHKPAPEKPE